MQNKEAIEETNSGFVCIKKYNSKISSISHMLFIPTLVDLQVSRKLQYGSLEGQSQNTAHLL